MAEGWSVREDLPFQAHCTVDQIQEVDKSVTAREYAAIPQNTHVFG
jgi:hypothetical protein